MKLIHFLIQSFKKFFKGCAALTALYLILASSVFLFDSCKKTESPINDGKARVQFLTALKSYKAKLGEAKLMHTPYLQDRIAFSGSNSLSGKIALAAPNDPNQPVEPIYLNFPPGTTQENINLVNQVTSVQQLADLQNTTNAVIQYSPTPENSNNLIQVYIDAVVSGLEPMILEAKQYLYAKGLTEQDIQDMLVEHNGRREDLVPFVIALTNVEVQPEGIARNYLSPFANTANAKLDSNDYIMCGLAAIGADVLYALTTSGLKTWSKHLIMKAFGTVAKRVMGPIGVAVAIVSFGVCLAERND